MALDVGIAQAIVRRPSGNPPEDQTVLWFEQTDPVQPQLGILRWFNSETATWEQLKPDTVTTFARETFTVVDDGETDFILAKLCVRPELSRVHVDELGELQYGTDYNLAGADLVFLPINPDGENWVLKAGDVISITYFF